MKNAGWKTCSGNFLKVYFKATYCVMSFRYNDVVDEWLLSEAESAYVSFETSACNLCEMQINLNYFAEAHLSLSLFFFTWDL